MDDLEKSSSSDLQSESWSITTVYDAVYEKDNAEFETVNAVQGVNVVEENENAIQEEVYEEYDGDYQEYMPRYATYSKKSESITQKFLKKKMLAILVILGICAVGVIVGLSVGLSPPYTTVSPTTTVSRTTTVPLIETASATGTFLNLIR